MILSLYEFSMSYPWPMEWLTSGICGYEISDVQEMAEAPWMQPLVLHLRSVLADLVKSFASRMCLRGRKTDRISMRR